MKIRVVLLLLLITAQTHAGVLIDSVKNISATSIGKYSKLEIAVLATAIDVQIYNVYDSSSVDMYAIFTSPSGKQYRRNAFWMMQYRRYDSSYYQKSRFLTVAIPVS